MTWESAFPLTAAERRVDFPAHLDHILHRRLLAERAAKRKAARLAFLLVDVGFTPNAIVDDLGATLARSLGATARFGYRHARLEITSFRAVTAAYQVPDAGRYGELARLGLFGILELVRYRAQRAAEQVAKAAREAADKQRAQDAALVLAAAADGARRQLHNVVLELVGEVLNMGRTAGALSFPRPPTFALRSEALDKRTCDPCTRLHGLIVEVDSPDYYANLPPTGCLGGGRCRGVMVFSDGVRDMRLPEAA